MNKQPNVNRDTKRPLALREQLRTFRQRFDECRQTGMQLSPEGVEFMLLELNAMESMANEMGNELSAFRWNAQAAIDGAAQAQAKAVLDAANQRNSNVILWPVCAKPMGDSI